MQEAGPQLRKIMTFKDKSKIRDPDTQIFQGEKLIIAVQLPGGFKLGDALDRDAKCRAGNRFGEWPRCNTDALC